MTTPPNTDERIPRGTLQRRLERILKRVDSTKVFRVEWTETLFGGRTREASTIEVDAVYVVGSFARGAPLCGDLDVVLTAHLIEGKFLPPSRTIAQAVARGLRDVQVHVGTPERNSSNAKFPDALLLWSQAARDWRQPLNAIRIDPGAGRFARPADALPLGLRQMRLYDLEVADKVVRLIADGVLASQWWPLDRPSSTPSAWDAETTRRFALLMESRGSDSKVILPHVFRYLWESKRSGAFEERDSREPTEFHLGSTLVRFGRPLLGVSPLDAPGTSTIVMAPRLTRKRPNGLWVLSRGPAHPVHALFADLTFWAEVDDDGHVPFTDHYDEFRMYGCPDHREADLFTIERKALSYYKELDGDGERTDVAPLSGARLLEAVGHADIVRMNAWHGLALTWAGRRFDDGAPPPKTLEEVAARDVDTTPLPTCADLAAWLRSHMPVSKKSKPRR